jgi:hypothetical protein
MAVNPALQLFLLATMQAYAFRWPVGPDRLLLVSVGTGVWDRVDDAADVASGKLWDWASRVPGMLMDDSSWQAQLMLQWWSNSATPWQIDRELGDLRGDVLGQRELLSYLRYDVRIEPECLRLMGMEDLAKSVAELHRARQRGLARRVRSHRPRGRRAYDRRSSGARDPVWGRAGSFPGHIRYRLRSSDEPCTHDIGPVDRRRGCMRARAAAGRCRRRDPQPRRAGPVRCRRRRRARRSRA